MKRTILLLLTLLLLPLWPAGAESAMPVPEGCTLTDGWTGVQTAMHLMDKPDGTTVLACFVRTEAGWTLTESTPLPEGTTLLTEYAAEGCMQLALPLTGGEATTAEVRLVNGAWQVTGLQCPQLWLDFRENGILGPECAWYGDVRFDGDITRLD